MKLFESFQFVFHVSVFAGKDEVESLNYQQLLD